MSVTLANNGRLAADTTLRTLIVEDNCAMARCLARIGKNFGSVTFQATVSGAFQQLVGRPVWSAFIVDLVLQDGSGLDVLSRIRAADRSVPALILTGNRDHDVINAAFDLRAQYLAKPRHARRSSSFLRRLRSAN
jgi:DNA-binding response OmpR family regulator